MERLDLQIRVQGHLTLNSSTRQILMADEAFSPLSHNLRMRFLGQAVIGEDSLAAQIQECAVVITDEWVVSIHGKNLNRCFSAMVVLINAIGQRLEASVTIDLLTRLNGNGESLERSVEIEDRNARIKEVVKITLPAAATLLVGLLLQWLFFGGPAP